MSSGKRVGFAGEVFLNSLSATISILLLIFAAKTVQIASFLSKFDAISIDRYFMLYLPAIFMQDFISAIFFFLPIFLITWLTLSRGKNIVDFFYTAIIFLVGCYLIFNTEFYKIFSTTFILGYARGAIIPKNISELSNWAADITSIPTVVAELVVVILSSLILPGIILTLLMDKRTITRVSKIMYHIVLPVVAIYFIFMVKFLIIESGSTFFFDETQKYRLVEQNPLIELSLQHLRGWVLFRRFFPGGVDGIVDIGFLRSHVGGEGYVFVDDEHPLVKESLYRFCGMGGNIVGECGRDADADGFDVSYDCDDLRAFVNPGGIEDASTWMDEDCNPENNEKQNVIYIITESLSSRTLKKAREKNITPNIERLLKEGIQYEKFYAAASISHRSLPAILCSTYPYFNTKEITGENPGLLCMPDVLKNEGYNTAFFSSDPQELHGEVYFLREHNFDLVFTSRNLTKNGEYVWKGENVEDLALIDPVFTWINSQKETPFFITYFTSATHFPYQVPDDFNLVADGRYSDAYYNTLYYTDHFIGEMIKNLEKQRLLNDTLIVLVADHGISFGSHGHFGHGVYIYEDYIKVPLIISNPVYFKGHVDAGTDGRHIDVTPTILDMLNIDVRNPFEGESLFSERKNRTSYFTNIDARFIGIKEGETKLILDENTGRKQLYDLETDPNETKNLENTHPNKTRELQSKLTRFARTQDMLLDFDRIWSPN